MLSLLLPLAHTQYASLPVLGSVLEKLCVWLGGKGFPLDAIRRRVVAARFLDECLRARGVVSLSGCTALQLQTCLPRERRWTPQIACALGRSLLGYLQERGELTTVPPTPSEQVAETYRDYLRRVRGLATRSARRHAVMALRFLHFLKYDDGSHGLGNLRVAEIDAFVTDEGRRVGRITMQKTCAT